YRVGERLTYTVSFSNFPVAAHVELFVAGRSTFSGREGVQLRAHVETAGVVSAALYSVNNDYVSYVDPATGLPFRVEQVVRDGPRAADAARDYNQPAGASALPAKRAGVFPGTYDLLSALYRLRTLPLAEGSAYRFTVQDAARQYDAELMVGRRELLKTNIGSVNAIATQVRVRGDKQADGYRVRIYFSDDERRVPVLITAQHPAGEIRADIASADIVTEAPPPAVAATSPPVAARPRDRRPSENNNGGNSGDSSLADLPFKVGEQLNFSFFLGDAAQPVGTASFQVRTRARYFNRDGLLLTALLQTANAGQRLFPVNDQVSSYVDVTTLLPFRTELRLQEGRRRANWTVTVEQDRGTALFDDGARLEVPVGTHDFLSVLYALRSFDLTPPKRNAVSLLINKRPRTLFITALRRDTIEVGGQRIPAVQLSLITDDPQGDRLQLRLWVSSDRRRLPLRLTAVTPIGP
ncbi:MAG: DUF3108 domain-containing protein, partial [Pyrinomonadaceae bacterium]